MIRLEKFSKAGHISLLLLSTGLLLFLLTLVVTPNSQSNEMLIRILAAAIAAIGAVLQIIDQLYKMQHVSPQDVNEAADRLMGQVLGQVTDELTKLLGTSRITTTAADLTYQGADGLVQFCESDSDNSGTLETIGDYFTKHVPQRRMVILGQAGSGKTMLALELVTQLLGTRKSIIAPQRRARLPVPIRFSLPTWDTKRPLKQWLTSQVAAQYGTTEKLAQRLVDDYRVLH